MTSSNKNICRVTGHLYGESPATGEFPVQRPVTTSFDVFFDLFQNKRLRKQWWGWWFEKPSCPLWRHCDAEGHFIKTTLRITIFRSVHPYTFQYIHTRVSEQIDGHIALNNRYMNVNTPEIYRPAAKGLYSLSGKTYYRRISWSFEAARLDIIMLVLLWNLTSISAALLPMCLSNFRAMVKV